MFKQSGYKNRIVALRWSNISQLLLLFKQSFLTTFERSNKMSLNLGISNK